MKRVLKGFFNFLLVFAGLLTVLFLYQLLAVKHGLLPITIMQTGGMSQELILFNIFMLLPLAAIFMWHQVEKHWPDLYIPTPRIRGQRWLISLTRWRAAFLTSLLSILLIEITL